MTDIVKTISSFVKEVVARLKGDDAEVLAHKNERKARSAINGQISSLESHVVDQEDRLSEAEESYKNALYPTVLITDGSSYVRTVRDRKNAVETARENLEETKKSLQFFKELLEEQFK